MKRLQNIKSIVLFNLTLFMLISIKSIAQDFEPEQKKFVLNGTPQLIEVDNMSQFKMKDKFIWSLHWGTSRMFMNKMGINHFNFFTTTGNDILDSNLAGDSCFVTLNAYKIADHFVNRIFYAPTSIGIQYEPTLLIDATRPNYFKEKESDTSKSIFGFKNIQQDTTLSVGDENYDRLVLKPSLLGGASSKLVLSQNWMDDALWHSNNLGYTEGDDPTLITRYYNVFTRDNYTNSDTINVSELNGDKFYLSLNLRLLSSNISVSPSEELLSIKLKYHKMNGDSGYVKFDSIPKSTLDTIQLNYNRGVAQSLQSISTPYTDNFTIRKGLLKYPTNIRPDITISAHFNLSNVAAYLNPLLKRIWTDYNDNLNRIDKLELEVTYYGKEKLAIDWIRLETKHAQLVHRGFYDSIITARLQHVLDTMQAPRFANKGVKLARIYTVDEPPISKWSQMHYMFKLLGNICTYEGTPIFWNHQQHYFNKNEVWMIPYSCVGWVSSPYSNLNTRSLFSFGMENGLYNIQYKPFDSNSLNFDVFQKIMNSNYETFVGNSDINTGEKYANYLDTVSLGLLYKNASFQSIFQTRLQENYLDTNHNQYLFNGTKWWSQTNLDPEYAFYIDTLRTNSTDTFKIVNQLPYFRRQLTGEEMSMFCNQALILGCKGLAFDGESSSIFQKDMVKNHNKKIDTLGKIKMSNGSGFESTRSWLDTLTEEEYMYSDIIGTDFLSLDTSSSSSEWTRINKYINFPIFEKETKTSKQRLYLGRKSMRTSVYKVHRWVKQNEDLILRMQLLSWAGKGFKETYRQSSQYRLRSLSTYIDTDSVKTRKLYNIVDTTSLTPYNDGYGYFANPSGNYEKHDSSFYDVTLLKDTTKSIDSVFYIGVLNRRTDPLVLIDQRDGVSEISNNFQNFYFASSAEFEDGIQKGGKVYYYNGDTTTIEVTKDTTFWRDLWWKKNGVREISLPFNYRPSAPGGNPTILDSNTYCLLRVREVYDSSNSAKNIRKLTETKLIDTIIGQDSRLVMNFQPGEGKLLKVEVIYPPTIIYGNLSNSNQHKLVCVPMINSYGQEIDSVIYFASYHRKDTDTTKVFLRASYPIKKDVSGALENIRWQNEIRVSTNIIDYLNDGLNPLTLNPLTCHYPSIVAQKDSNSGASSYRIAIVYACDRKVDDKSQIIASTMYKFSPATQLITRDGNQVQFNVRGESKDYGHPVINASRNYNFVAFSDSLGGIIFSSFAKNQYNYSKKDSVNCQPNYFIFQNPSFNAYSNLINGDTSASLVWTGRTKIGGILGDSYPFYTRIKLNSSGDVNNYIPKFNTASGNNFIDWGYEISSDSSYIKFLWGGRAARYPVVYKVVRPSTGQLLGEGNEYLSWQRSYENDTVNFLFNLKLGFKPSENLFGVNNHFTLVVKDVNDYGFTHPNIAQKNGKTGYDPTPSSEAVLNFTYNQNIWQKPLTDGVFNKGVYQSLSESTLITQFEKLANGDFSHLSMSPKENDNANMWKNRRIYNDTSQNSIYTSAKMFYKVAIGGGTQYAEGYVGYECDTANYYIQFPKLNGNDLNLFLPYKNSFDSTLGNILVQNNLDTIKSEWFTIGTSEYLQLKSFGTLNANCMLFIQRQDSNAIYPITYTRSGSEWLTTKLNITLTNGGGHNYRLVLKRIVDSTYHYMERVVFGELDIASNLNLKSNSNVENQVINMMTGTKAESIYNIIAMPNPAENDVKLMFTVPNTFDSKTELNNVNLEIINQVGKVVMSKSTNTNQIEQINLKDYNQGVYFVRATFVNNITKAIEETKLIPLYIVR